MPTFAEIGTAVAVALVLSFAMTPAVRMLARRIGAIDVPNDPRRIHTHPIPRLGGLSIFIGFMLSVLFFVEITVQLRGILIGAVIIVIIGAIDDVKPQRAIVKLIVQIIAALVAIFHGTVIDIFSNPLIFLDAKYVSLGVLSIPITVIWIVAITNFVNLIDGLDGLAVGISAISAIVMMIIALMFSEIEIAVIMAALAGACLGFLPYNFNPARLFLGDSGALMLGFVLATVSIQGLFKFYAAISIAVPLLVLALPLFDGSFAFLRRLAEGRSPMSADRGHIHHRLLDRGMSQRQAVLLMYAGSGILGFIAVVIAASDSIRAFILIVAVIIASSVVFFGYIKGSQPNPSPGDAKPDKAPDSEPGPGVDGLPATSSGDIASHEAAHEPPLEPPHEAANESSSAADDTHSPDA